MPPRDFSRHNAEVQEVWASYERGDPIRVPVGRFTIGPRIWVFDPLLNTNGITWKTFSRDPEVMFQVLLAYKHYQAHHIVCDSEMGIPSGAWEIFTEFVNVTEEAWLGCEVVYPEGQVSATHPCYTGDRGREILDRGIPDPFDGILGQVRECYEYFCERARSYEFHGRPVKVLPPCPVAGTNGIFTVALNLRGEELLSDLYTDPDYYHTLMDLVTRALVLKTKAWRRYLGTEERPCQGFFADDMIQLLSPETYREHVLPYHRRFLSELYGEGPHGIHLCGHVQRHFPTLVRELNIRSFDTGYPIHFETLRDEVGDDVEIAGGVPVPLLMTGRPDEVARETERILTSGILRGRRFILKEANNVPPRIPLDNLEAMYETARRVGRYR